MNEKANLLKTITLAAVTGALYGLFVTPLWSESVEFGQVWAGFLDYTHSPWGQVVTATPNLQIIVPAVLLKLGLGTWPLSLLASAFFCANSYVAIAATSFIITRNVLFSLSMPFLLLSYQFPNANGYPVIYPIDYFQFGQTGQYLALFSFALVAGGLSIFAGFAGGLLAGVHPVWCMCFAMGTFPIIALKSRADLKNLGIAFAIGCSVALGVQFAGARMLPSRPIYTLPTIPETAKKPAIESDKPVLDVKARTRKTFEGHNVLFADSPSVARAVIAFFLPSIALVILSGLLFLITKSSPSFAPAWSSVYLLLLLLSVPLGAATIFKLIEELDPTMNWLALVDPRLPPLALRLIINRWFNLASLLMPVLTFGILWLLASVAGSWVACVAFVIPILRIGKQTIFITDNFPFVTPMGWRFFALIVAAMLTSRFWTWPQLARFQRAFANGILAICLIAYLVTSGRQAFNSRAVLGTDSADPLVEVAKRDKGQLIVSSGIISIRGFNPQLRTERPIILPSQLDIYDSTSQKAVQVFCYADLTQPIAEFYRNIKPCFELRSKEEWQAVGQETHSTGLITPSEWKLQIEPVVSAGGFSYYRL